MAGSIDSRMAVIRTLIDTAPDSVIRSLDMALSADNSDGVMGVIRQMVATEAAERRARAMTLAPVIPLCPSKPSPRHENFPGGVPRAVWKALKVERADVVAEVITASTVWTNEETDGTPFDVLCVDAAAMLRSPLGTAFVPVAAMLEAAEAGGAERFASYLELVPLARDALAHLGDWLGRMTEERAASVRLAFRDAVDHSPDAGPMFLDILIGQMDEPWLVLRIVSALMDRPSDGYMAGSELAHIGERLLDEVDSHLEALRNFDPQSGVAAGAQAGEAARIIVHTLAEFEHSLDLKRDGPWGSKVVKQRRELAQIVELRLSKVDDAVEAALPTKSVKLAGRLMKGVPKLLQDPEDRAVVKAEGYLAFLDNCRASAPTGGYAALRNKIVEKLGDRLDQYAEDLIEEMRNEDSANHERAKLYLELCARFVGFVRDEKAAQIVRRRAAA